MIEVTKEEAKKLIKEQNLVSISWMTDGCPNCVHFEELLDQASIELEGWNLYKIEIPFDSKDLIFEPSMFPTNFIFNKGIRTVVAVGICPLEEVLKTYREIQEGTFKTDEMLEQEQLDALDEQE